jgi:protein-disulfide isomerase
MKRWQIVVLSGVVLLAVFALAGFLFKDRQREALGSLARSQAGALIREHSPVLGSAGAKVAIVEFLDPGCETCRVFDPFVKQLMAAYPGKIKLVIRYAPLHHGADQMVAVLEAARRQGKYWETLQLMYDAQPYWAAHHNPQPQLMWQFLPQVGLDLERLRRDAADPAIARLIEQDMADAKALGVTKTPGFFVNGKPLVVFGHQQLQALVEAELRASY